MSTTTFEHGTTGSVIVLRAAGAQRAAGVQRAEIADAQVRERRSPQGELRLTRRGRIVLLTVALLAAMGIGVLFGAVSVAASEGGDVPTEVVVVSEGDTLWGIAAEIADDGEVPSVMADIERLNALDSYVLQLGQKLRVPLAEN